MRYVRQSPAEVLYLALSRGSSRTRAAGWVVKRSHIRALRSAAKSEPEDSIAEHVWQEGGSLNRLALPDGDAIPKQFVIVQNAA